MPRLLDGSTLRSANPRRICIVKPSAFGDVVQSLPVLTGLRARWPDASICWVIRSDLSDLVDGHPLIDEWLPFERRGGARPFLTLLQRLHEGRFDLVVDLQGLARSALMTWATGAKIRVGLQNSRDASFLAHNYILPETGREVKATVRYWRLAEVVDCGAVRPEARVPVTTAAKQRADELLGPLKGGILAVHPGAAWLTKRWPVGRFSAVAARAVRELGLSVIVLGQRRERPIAARLIANLRATVPGAPVYDATGQTSIGVLAAVLKRVDLMLTNDSGPMHLAAALGIPVVGVFTATDARRSGPAASDDPQGPRHELVTTPVDCRACYRRRCPLSGTQRYACQRDLTVDHVWQAMLRCARRNGLVADPLVISESAAAGPVLPRTR